MAETRDVGQPSIVRRGFQLFQRIDAQVVVQPPGVDRADTGNRLQQLHRIAFSAQAIQHREPSEAHDIANRDRQPVADAGQFAQPFKTLALENLADRPLQATHGLRPAPVGLYAERAGALFPQQTGDFVQPHRYLRIQVHFKC